MRVTLARLMTVVFICGLACAAIRFAPWLLVVIAPFAAFTWQRCRGRIGVGSAVLAGAVALTVFEAARQWIPTAPSRPIGTADPALRLAYAFMQGAAFGGFVGIVCWVVAWFDSLAVVDTTTVDPGSPPRPRRPLASSYAKTVAELALHRDRPSWLASAYANAITELSLHRPRPGWHAVAAGHHNASNNDRRAIH